MSLDRLALILKVGDKAPPNSKEHLGIKEGMPVCYIDEAEWGKPLEEIISPNMCRVYAVLEVDPSLKPKVKEYLLSVGDFDDENNKELYRPRSKTLPLADLETLTSDHGLVDKLRSETEVVDIIDCKFLTDKNFKDSLLVTTTYPKIVDNNSVPSGSYTVGVSGDYATFALATADIANLTGDLTFTLISDITETARGEVTENLGGYTLTFTSNSPHYGDPTVGWKVTYNHGNYGFYHSEEGPGTVEYCNLHSERIVSAGALSTILVQSITTEFTLNIHDLIIDSNNLVGDNLSAADATPIINMYNVVCNETNTYSVRGIAVNGKSRFENISVYDCWRGFDCGNQPGEYRNCASFAGAIYDFANTSSASGFNNLSTDATAGNANWASGLGNIVSQTASSCVSSLDIANANFLKVTVDGPMDSSGVVNTIAARTVGIRNNAVPNYKAKTSIGAAEIPVSAVAPSGAFTQDTTSGNAPLTVNFTDQSTNTPTSWDWDFDASGTPGTDVSTSQNPQNIYATSGTYSVKLVASNVAGFGTIVKEDLITVTVAPPVANFSATPLSGTTSTSIAFTDSSTNTPTSWLWDFDASGSPGTDTSTLQNPTNTYASSGVYSVKLTATNAGGSASTTSGNYITVTEAIVIIGADYNRNGKQISFLASGQPNWGPSYHGRLVFRDDTSELLVGGDAQWINITTGGISPPPPSGHTHRHRDIVNLDADDHTQYALDSLLDSTSGHLNTQITANTSALAGASGALQSEINTASGTLSTKIDVLSGSLAASHGDLTGLGDDDHSQYHNNLRGDNRYYKQAEVASISGVLSSGTQNSIVALSGTLSAEIDSDIATVSGTLSAEINSDVSLVSGTLQSEINSASGTLNTKIDLTSGSIVTDHGALTGLADDDHPQYATDVSVSAVSGLLQAEIDSDVAAVSGTLNTTISNHVSNNGSDHSYIDQDVTIGALPMFNAVSGSVGDSAGGIEFGSNFTQFGFGGDKDLIKLNSSELRIGNTSSFQETNVRMHGQSTNNAFYMKYSTGRVGIQTDTPDEALDVSGNVGCNRIQHFGDNDTYIGFDQGPDDRMDFRVGDLNLLIINQDTNNNFFWFNPQGNDVDFHIDSSGANENSIYTKGDTGYTGFGTNGPTTRVDVRGGLNQQDGLSTIDTPYAGIYQDNTNNVIDIVTQNVPVPISGNTSGHVRDFTLLGTSGIVCQTNGHYGANWSISTNIAAPAIGDSYECALYVNGSREACSAQHRTHSTASDEGVWGGPAILDLNVNDVVTLEILNADAADDITIGHCNLVLYRIGN